MNINELQVKQGKVELTAKVKEKGDVREFNKFGKTGRVCNAVIEDNTGKVILTLWNEQAEMVNIGDTIQIENGYVGEYQGEKQLTTGKFGQLTVVKKNAPLEKNGSVDKNSSLNPQTVKNEEIRINNQLKEKPNDAKIQHNNQEKEHDKEYYVKVEEEFID